LGNFTRRSRWFKFFYGWFFFALSVPVRVFITGAKKDNGNNRQDDQLLTPLHRKQNSIT
jgi:hypothetical protein